MRRSGHSKSVYQDIYLFLPKAVESMKVPTLNITHIHTQVIRDENLYKRNNGKKMCNEKSLKKNRPLSFSLLSSS